MSKFPLTPWASIVPALALASLPALADPAPVRPGLWEVQLLTTYAPLRPGASAPTAAKQQRRYRICLSPQRAAAPMARLPGAERTEVVIGRNTLSGTYIERAPDGTARPVEFLYRRLDQDQFEGSHDVSTAVSIARTQYLARRLGPGCGGLAPSTMALTGEP